MNPDNGGAPHGGLHLLRAHTLLTGTDRIITQNYK